MASSALTVMTVSEWPRMSCRSRANRLRSSSTASRAFSSCGPEQVDVARHQLADAPHREAPPRRSRRPGPAGLDQPGTSRGRRGRAPATSQRPSASAQRGRAGTSRRRRRRRPTAAVPASPMREHHARQHEQRPATASASGRAGGGTSGVARSRRRPRPRRPRCRPRRTRASPRMPTPAARRVSRRSHAAPQRVDQEEQPDGGEQHAERAGPAVAVGPDAGRGRPCSRWSRVVPRLRPGPCPCSSATRRRPRRRSQTTALTHGVPRQLAGERRAGDLGDAEHRGPVRDVPQRACPGRAG